jgi:two-component system sensor histidine kinase PilS (NtrC family)
MKAIGTNSEKKLRTLITWRLFVSLILLVSTWLWSGGLSASEPLAMFARFALPFLIIGGLSAVYFAAVHFNRRYGYQVRAQFFFDVVLITWLVWETGDISSPYITLYIVLISTASLFVTPRETLLFSAVCALALATMPVIAGAGFMTVGSSAVETSKAVQIVGFNVVAFLVVGMLASRLAERKFSGEELKETARSLASLRAVHERIVESIRSGLITADLDGRIYTFNKAASEITGFAPAEMVGKHASVLLENFDEAVRRAGFGDADEPGLRFECDLVSADGFALRLGYNIAPLFSERGEKSGLIVTFQDLTDIRLMEESARRKDRLAALGRVAAGLAHEIRNPLGAVRGSIQVLKSGMSPDSSQAGLMDIVIRESDRLNDIISNFLLYARPRAGNFSEVDVREAIRDTMVLLEHSPDKTGAHVFEAVMPEEPLILTADPTQLKQIFWNLARNSLQAMREGGTFSIEASDAGERVRIVFSDTGCGMSAEQVEKLFEPFSESTTGGTGLGLSIVYQIVRDHNGSIAVRSREGNGTSITVDLPAGRRSVQLTDLPDDDF